MAEEFVKIKDFNPKLKRINVIFKVISVDAAKNVRSKKDRIAHRISEALVGDETGVVLMTLWDESVDKIKDGKTLKLMNGYLTLFKGTIRLNIGKYGSIEETEDLGADVEAQNNVSTKLYDDNTRRGREYEGFGSGSFWP